MVSSGPSQDQDQKYKNLVEQAIQKVREEFAARLEEIRRQFGLAQKEMPVGLPDASQELFEAVAAIDRSRTQAEILTTLLEGCRRFAGRSALFLARGDGLHGWAGSGFNASSDQVGELVMGYGEGTPWSRVVEGYGGVALSGPECAGLCARIDGSHPTEGLLIPLVLRDRLAAAVYADRMEKTSILDPSALQLLTYVAAQAIETLPLRERSATATLRLPHEPSSGEPRLELWLGQETAPAAPRPPEPSVVAPEPVAPEVEVTPVEVTPVEPTPVQVTPVEPPPVEPAPVEPPPVEAIPEPWEAEQPVEEPISAEPQIPETEVIPEEPEIAAPASPQDTGELEQVASTGFEMQSVEEVEVEPSVPVQEEPTQTFPTGDYTTAVPEVPTEAPPEPASDTQPAVPSRGSATEIIPPSDLEEGPGWAFATSTAPADSADETLHEEAQRLARLLVTEIKLYNEEEVEEGRRNRNIYQTLREDINRSRQIYEERINEKIRAETDYFHEELVRILAGGDADALGM